MTTFDQIICKVPDGDSTATHLASSLMYPDARRRWLTALSPWLRASGPASRGYVVSGSRAALIRRPADAVRGVSADLAHVLAGPAAELHAAYALEIDDLSAGTMPHPRSGRLATVTSASVARSTPQTMERRSRSREVIEALVPLLSRVLAGDQRVELPGEPAAGQEAVLWALVNIMSMLGDTRPVQFLIRASVAPTVPKPWIAFTPDAAPRRPGSEFEPLALGLAGMYADGPEELRRMLQGLGIAGAHDHEDKLSRLRVMWPSPPVAPATVPPATVPSPVVRQRDIPEFRVSAGDGGNVVTCPMCLDEIADWEGLQRWRWDPDYQVYKELEIPAGASPLQRRSLYRDAFVRCPDRANSMAEEHYLPFAYGTYGPPVVLGFVGDSVSGKTHLLATMIGEIEREGLRDYGVEWNPVERQRHKRFLDGSVIPLVNEGKVLPGTGERVVEFADALILTPRDGQPRAVAFFDVAGGELASDPGVKKFLDVASGLFFLVDPGKLGSGGIGDPTFGGVLGLVKEPGRPNDVSAAIVLTKADMVRFDDPVTRWLRNDRTRLDAAEFLRESADVYAYLHSRNATAWTRPYAECTRATLHVVSPTGSAADYAGGAAVFPRGVRPLRVLRPLVAMLAMTGVLSGAEAEKVGI